MNDADEFLSRLTPRGPDAAVAARVQDAMKRALADVLPSAPARQRRFWKTSVWGWLTAAAILFGIGLNYIVAEADRARQKRWVQFDLPPPAVRELARMVEAETDAATAASVESRYRETRRNRSTPAQGQSALEKYIERLMGELGNATIEEIPEVDGRRRGQLDRHSADRERGVRLADRPASGGAAEQIAGGRGAVVAG